MTKKTAPKKSQKNNFNVSILLMMTILLLSTAVYLVLKQNSSRKTAQKLETELTVDQTDTWETYPTKGSYTGWTIKHPAQNKPEGVQNDYRIPIVAGDINDIYMAIQNGKDNGESIEEITKNIKENDRYCELKNDITEVTVNNYKGYEFVSTCDTKTKATFVIKNPYVANNYVTIKIYTQQPAQEELAQQILDTLNFIVLEPEINDGLIEITDVTIGFSLRHPENYKTATDSAWKNSSIILYTGGQVYDLVVQVWNTEDEYKKFFGETYSGLENMTIQKVGNKIVTLLNQNNSEEVDKIIQSFKVETE